MGVSERSGRRWKRRRTSQSPPSARTVVSCAVVLISVIVTWTAIGSGVDKRPLFRPWTARPSCRRLSLLITGGGGADAVVSREGDAGGGEGSSHARHDEDGTRHRANFKDGGGGQATTR